MYKIEITKTFKKSFKKLQKNGFNTNLLYEVVEMLARGETLPRKYENHPLKGKYINSHSNLF